MITLLPALIVLATGADPTSVLVISQVVLSFGLPFVLVPLLRLTGQGALMGGERNGRGVAVIGWLITVAIVCLNAVLIVGIISELCGMVDWCAVRRRCPAGRTLRRPARRGRKPSSSPVVIGR